MKYIKTENGVYEVINFMENVDVYNVKTNHTELYSGLISYDSVIKEADNLESLFDLLVAVNRKEWHITILKKAFEFEDKFTPVKNCSLKSMSGWIEFFNTWYKDYDIYGAVWTPKGLKYIAKYNKEGEAEYIWD